jgi:thioredoxin-like negative regulator of GroEL
MHYIVAQPSTAHALPLEWSKRVPKRTPLTRESFVKFVRGHKFAVVHFWASWNDHDVRMKKLLESEIPSDLSERIAFATFEVDPAEHHEICRQHKVLNIPFLAFYRDGALVRTSTGVLAPEVITQYFKNLVDETS